MKKNLFLASIVIVLVGAIAYIGGVFEVKVEVKSSVKKDAIELTDETLDKTKQSTDQIYNEIKRKLNEANK